MPINVENKKKRSQKFKVQKIVILKRTQYIYLLTEMNKFDSRQCFCEYVRQLFIRRYVFQIEFSFAESFSDEMKTHIYVFGAFVKFWVFHQFDCTLAVHKKRWFSLVVRLDFAQ